MLTLEKVEQANVWPSYLKTCNNFWIIVSGSARNRRMCLLQWQSRTTKCQILTLGMLKMQVPERRFPDLSLSNLPSPCLTCRNLPHLIFLPQVTLLPHTCQPTVLKSPQSKHVLLPRLPQRQQQQKITQIDDVRFGLNILFVCGFLSQYRTKKSCTETVESYVWL